MNPHQNKSEGEYIRSSYAIVPSYILDDDKLQEGAKTLYARISMYSQDGKCWASNAHFAEKQKVDVRTISRWLGELKDQGYIIVEIDTSGWQTKRIIWLTNDFKKFNTKGHTCPPPLTPQSPPPDTNVMSGDDIDVMSSIKTNNNKTNKIYKQHGENVVVGAKKRAVFSKDDVYFACNKLKKDWSSEEIESAFQAFESSKSNITDPMKYLEGIINKKRNLKNKGLEKCQKIEITNQIEEISTNLSTTDKPRSLGKGTGTGLLAQLVLETKMRRKSITF